MKKSICLIGTNLNLEKKFKSLGFSVDSYGRLSDPCVNFLEQSFLKNLDLILTRRTYSLYLIITGFLQPKKILEQSMDEINKSFLINSAGPVMTSETILERDEKARIFILGSESGKKGSYDMTYALSKSTLRMYTKTRRVKSCQQLILLSPSTIEDMGMTVRRTDRERLEKYKAEHPKKRFLNTNEIAEIVDKLYQCTNYITNIEIEINGGKFT